MLISCNCEHGMIWHLENKGRCLFRDCNCKKLDPKRICINGIEWIPTDSRITLRGNSN